jgi:hypothetical protein
VPEVALVPDFKGQKIRPKTQGNSINSPEGGRPSSTRGAFAYLNVRVADVRQDSLTPPGSTIGSAKR